MMFIKKFLFYLLLSAVILDANCTLVYAGRIEGVGVGTLDEALFDATVSGDTQKAAELIKKGAFVGKKYKGIPLLSYAIKNKRQDIAKMLILKGADLNACDDGGMTVLMCAALYGNKEIVNLLLSKGAIVNKGDNFRRIAIMYALDGYDYKIDKSGDRIEIVKTLLSKCSDINYRDLSYDTILMDAAREGYLEAVKLLISKGVQVNFKNTQNQTALDIAKEEMIWMKGVMANDYAEIIEVLKKAGGR